MVLLIAIPGIHVDRSNCKEKWKLPTWQQGLKKSDMIIYFQNDVGAGSSDSGFRSMRIIYSKTGHL